MFSLYYHLGVGKVPEVHPRRLLTTRGIPLQQVPRRLPLPLPNLHRGHAHGKARARARLPLLNGAIEPGDGCRHHAHRCAARVATDHRVALAEAAVAEPEEAAVAAVRHHRRYEVGQAGGRHGLLVTADAVVVFAAEKPVEGEHFGRGNADISRLEADFAAGSPVHRCRVQQGHLTALFVYAEITSRVLLWVIVTTAELVVNPRRDDAQHDSHFPDPAAFVSCRRLETGEQARRNSRRCPTYDSAEICPKPGGQIFLLLRTLGREPVCRLHDDLLFDLGGRLASKKSGGRRLLLAVADIGESAVNQHSYNMLLL